MLRAFVVLPVRWLFQNLMVPVGRMFLHPVLRPLWVAFAWVAAITLIPFTYVARLLGRGFSALWRAVPWPLLTAPGRLSRRRGGWPVWCCSTRSYGLPGWCRVCW